MRKYRLTRYGNITLFLTLLLGLAGPGWAVDGVIEINQARALAGGVTASDTAGFPVTIDAPGSYRLTSNLEVAATTVHAVEINTGNLTLDLNGFAIIGPGSGTGYGVYTNSQDNITVVNGTVRDMGFYGVRLSTRAHVERVRAFNNGSTGIYAQSGSTVSGNTAFYNGSTGIYASYGSTVSGNTAYWNYSTGIYAGTGSRVTGNTCRYNTNYGLYLGSDSGYANNVLTNNNGGNANPQVYGGIQMDTNVCGANTTCP